jgi:predicted XRE-type DNA-binding protein
MAYELCAKCGEKKHQLKRCKKCGFTKRRNYGNENVAQTQQLRNQLSKLIAQAKMGNEQAATELAQLVTINPRAKKMINTILTMARTDKLKGGLSSNYLVRGSVKLVSGGLPSLGKRG